ncbi:E3 ubiquitin-protein ligase TTC3 [Teratosphaeria destructans]|uniref:E3 ubiquitin-protein ligase TTC3 n=1 Tax=Teratosphaeria destructans TaxID=418781 RepID=A0A9W7SWN4_9PEZI|nr:E3 ubiquitin-protein ligase TTC3 [Teratosphaeria destructans]
MRSYHINNPAYKYQCTYETCVDANGNRRTFRDQHSVNQHVRAHHLGDEGRIHKCNLCPPDHRGFARPWQLYRHERTIHGIDRAPGKGGTKRRRDQQDAQNQPLPQATNRREDIEAYMETMRAQPAQNDGPLRKGKAGAIANHVNDGFVPQATPGMDAQLTLPPFRPFEPLPQHYVNPFSQTSNMLQQGGGLAAGGQQQGGQNYGYGTNAQGFDIAQQQHQQQVGQNYGYGTNAQGFDIAQQQRQQQVGQSEDDSTDAQGFDIAPRRQRRRRAIQPVMHICRRDPARCTFRSGDAQEYMAHLHQAHGEPVGGSCRCRICRAARGQNIPQPAVQTYNDNYSVDPALLQQQPQAGPTAPNEGFDWSNFNFERPLQGFEQQQNHHDQLTAPPAPAAPQAPFQQQPQAGSAAPNEDFDWYDDDFEWPPQGVEQQQNHQDQMAAPPAPAAPIEDFDWSDIDFEWPPPGVEQQQNHQDQLAAPPAPAAPSAPPADDEYRIGDVATAAPVLQQQQHSPPAPAPPQSDFEIWMQSRNSGAERDRSGLATDSGEQTTVHDEFESFNFDDNDALASEAFRPDVEDDPTLALDPGERMDLDDLD